MFMSLSQPDKLLTYTLPHTTGKGLLHLELLFENSVLRGCCLFMEAEIKRLYVMM
jgi:hypothetical protein